MKKNNFTHQINLFFFMTWNIYGQQYDLSSFIDSHPGGKDILMHTKNQEDITALFETFHAFTDKSILYRQLQKYKIGSLNKNPSKYDFTSYHDLTSKIKNQLQISSRGDVKADTSWYVQNIMTCCLYLYCFYQTCFGTYTMYIKCILAFLSGLLYISLGFNVMHDASHYAVSIFPNVNILMSRIWNAWGLWNSKIWFHHHVFNHHSYTGVPTKDPDLYYLKPLVRKNLLSKKGWLHGKNYINSHVMFFILLFPGLYGGQIILYTRAMFSSRYVNLKLDGIRNDYIDIIFIFSKLYCLYVAGFFPSCFYLCSLNLWYSINIMFDHDTYENVVENHYDGSDWLRLQVCNSGNFMNENIIWTRMFGAINYQIEHHLFPSMSNVHYPTISPIVREYCKEHNIPYVNHKNMVSAYVSYVKMIKHIN